MLCHCRLRLCFCRVQLGAILSERDGALVICLSRAVLIDRTYRVLVILCYVQSLFRDPSSFHDHEQGVFEHFENLQDLLARIAEIKHGREQASRVVPKATEADIARFAQHAADIASLPIMVDGAAAAKGVDDCSTDWAAAALLGMQGEYLSDCHLVRTKGSNGLAAGTWFAQNVEVAGGGFEPDGFLVDGQELELSLFPVLLGRRASSSAPLLLELAGLLGPIWTTVIDPFLLFSYHVLVLTLVRGGVNDRHS